MKVVQFPKPIKEKKPIIILGGFSCIHLGHRELIKQAKKYNKKVIVFMFDKPHILPNKTSQLFEQQAVRIQKIANLGVDYVSLLKTNKDTLFTTAEKFMATIKEVYDPFLIICGEDNKFGHNAKGDVKLLKTLFKVQDIPLAKVSNVKISASIIKEQIPFGDIKFCNSLLTEPWTTKVTIESNNTFNLAKEQIEPHHGIYAVMVEIDEMIYHGVVGVSEKKELKLLNYKKPIQNKVVDIKWVQQLKIQIKDGDDKIEEIHMKQANELFKSFK